jgi:hypothetical protein
MRSIPDSCVWSDETVRTVSIVTPAAEVVVSPAMLASNLPKCAL